MPVPTVIAALNDIARELPQKGADILKRAEEKFNQSKAAFAAVSPEVASAEGTVQLSAELSKMLRDLKGTEGDIWRLVLPLLKLSLAPERSSSPGRCLDVVNWEKGTLAVPVTSCNGHDYQLSFPCAYAGKDCINPEMGLQQPNGCSRFFYQWGSNTKLGNHMCPDRHCCLRAATMEECVAWVMMHEIIRGGK